MAIRTLICAKMVLPKMIKGVLAIVAYLERRKRIFPGLQGSPQIYVTCVNADGNQIPCLTPMPTMAYLWY